jgi:hypothetical protein
MSNPADPVRRRRRAHPVSETAQAWEVRGSVTQAAYALLDSEAESLGRSRTWHVGMVLEAYAQLAQKLQHLRPHRDVERERADLDRLLRSASEGRDLDRLLRALRPVLRPAA